MRDFVLSSQAVTAAHPDKLSDQISDAMVDAFLSADEPSACIAECAIASGIVFLSLRHGGKLGFDPAALARKVLADEGYGGGPGGKQPTVMLDLAEVPEFTNLPARPSGAADHMTTAFGYACDHTQSAMPLPIVAAHRLCDLLDDAAKAERLAGIAADAQAQVAVRFADRRPVEITGIALSLFTPDAANHKDLTERVRAEILEPAFRDADLKPGAATRFVVTPIASPGGPSAHAGLTGRKSSEDGYGGFCRETSTALSGKHPGRIDRVAAYAARQAAVSVVRAGMARECEVQLSYVHGDRTPASLEVDCFNTAEIPEQEISAHLLRDIDFGIDAIAERLELWRLPVLNDGVFYSRLARKGHFGREDMELPWDRAVGLSG
ncbi:methionine adenosyltransferase domain-containing protein [Roseibium aggregatum]|uniref:Methionine adenosyltransferase domain-containing protein n=1 Tax=Roseibium aggregatum TaxID=187304 RepID=A0A939E9Y7_9HYPH|nr:methionine adenosyltransferase domain-containing protein [Roseibium aggregatum]MBN9669305.1 methionine adenosyltransferase domain-containing protein [Roseibium aggregatum]